MILTLVVRPRRRNRRSVSLDIACGRLAMHVGGTLTARATTRFLRAELGEPDNLRTNILLRQAAVVPLRGTLQRAPACTEGLPSVLICCFPSLPPNGCSGYLTTPALHAAYPMLPLPFACWAATCTTFDH